LVNFRGLHKSWEGNIIKEEQWVKNNTGRKISLHIEKGCFKKSQNYSSTGDSRTEYPT
jgi:hypothetical protein